MAEWSYDPAKKRFRYANGRLVPERTLARLRDRFIATQLRAADDLAANLADGKIGTDAWERAMRDRVKTAHVAEYLLGRGGKQSMTQADYGRIGRNLRDHYAYLARFRSAIEAGEITGAPAIGNRAKLYLTASIGSHERGRASAFGVSLPEYPGQKTRCLARCRCRWSLKDATDETGNTTVEATWVASLSESTCESCRDNAAKWAPLVIAAGGSA